MTVSDAENVSAFVRKNVFISQQSLQSLIRIIVCIAEGVKRFARQVQLYIGKRYEHMTQAERREYLIRYLLKENKQYADMVVPNGVSEQKDLLRALMNVRMPNRISPKFIEIQDEYLKEEIQREGIVDVEALKPLKCDKRLYIWQGDMSTLKIDAVQNPANSGMTGCYQPLHNCLDNILNSKAGISLRLYCNHIMQEQGHEEPTGQAKITPAFNLPSKYILHTVGPIIYDEVTDKEREQLASSYQSCLELAAEKGVKSIALCCVSTGVFRFPNREAAEIAVAAVKDFLAHDNRIEKVVFNVFKEIDLEIYRDLLGGDSDE